LNSNGVQLDARARTSHLPLEKIHLEVGNPQGCVLADDRWSPRQGVDPRQELGECEWLHQIVIAPRFQSLDAVVDAAERGQQKNRCPHAGAADGLHHGKPVEARQHPIDDHHVVFLAGREKQAVAAVGSELDGMAVLTQALG
jgi:hypothetical protein